MSGSSDSGQPSQPSRPSEPHDADAPSDPLDERALRRLLAMAAEDPEAVAPEVELPPRFRIVREVGRGGMGVVYEAFDQQLGRRCAIKTLATRTDESLRRRFAHEALAAARLHHPHIAAVHDATPEWLCLQFVDGGPLPPLVANADAAALRATVALVRDAARALHHAHERGLVHRDVKPSNLLVERGHVFVVDFGLAKTLDDDAQRSRSGALVGTPAFMAPEQVLGGACDARTDVHGLGATLHFVLTGRPPFAAASLGELLQAVAEREPPPVAGDRDLAVVVATCLAKDPARRYATAAALADDLDRWLRHEPIVARAPAFLDRCRKALRRHRAVVRGVLLATAATALLVALVLLPIAWRESAARAAAAEAVALADHSAAVLQDAAMFGRLGDHRSAWQLLDSAIVRTEGFLARHDVARVRYLRSRLLRARGRFDDALHELERTIATAPELADARCERGLLRAAVPSPDAAAIAAAVDDLQAGLATPADGTSVLGSVERLFARAELLRLRADDEQAEDLLREVLEYEPTHVAARRSLARLALRRGDEDLARYYSASAVDLQQGYGPVYLARERQVLPTTILGLDGLLVDFAGELGSGPDNALALAHRGLVQLRRSLRLSREGHAAEALDAAQAAVDDYTTTLQLHDELAGAHNNRAVCRLVVADLAAAGGDSDRAARERAAAGEDLQQALATAPGSAEAHANVGLLQLRLAATSWALGRGDAARRQADQAVASLRRAAELQLGDARHAEACRKLLAHAEQEAAR